jgi:hypothetical protein
MLSQLSTNEIAQKYIEKQVKLWLGVAQNTQVAIPEMPEYLKQLFLRCEENQVKSRDFWGNWEHSYSQNYIEGKLWIPEVDVWLKNVRDNIDSNLLTPLWPNNKKFAVCLSHDVDFISEKQNFKQILRRFSLLTSYPKITSKQNINLLLTIIAGFLKKGIKSLHTSDIEKVIEIERKFKVVSSYFFTVFPISKKGTYDCTYKLSDKCKFFGRKMSVANLMQELDAEGFDVGLHGSYYSGATKDMHRQQISSIETATGLKITTNRQHWLNFNINNTPVLLHEAGILADSTLGFNRNIGFRAGTSLPFFMFDLNSNTELNVLQVPLIIQEGALTALNSLEYDKEMAQNAMKIIIDRIYETNGCATLLFHPNSFNKPIYCELYEWAIEYCLQKGAWVTSLKEINNWWRQRANLLV